MDGEHSAFGAIGLLSPLSQNVERRQDEAVVGGHLHWLPIVVELVHCFGESGVLLVVKLLLGTIGCLGC